MNPLGRHNKLKCVCTKQQNQKINEAKSMRAERRNRKTHNYNLGLQQSSQQPKFEYSCNIAKAMFREKFILLNTHIRNEERSQINNLNFYTSRN